MFKSEWIKYIVLCSKERANVGIFFDVCKFFGGNVCVSVSLICMSLFYEYFSRCVFRSPDIHTGGYS